MSQRYSGVPTRDVKSTTETSEEERKRRRTELAERISNKLHAAFWTIVAGVVVYYTDFVRVLLQDDRVKRPWFNLATACFAVNCVIMGYLTLWLPLVQRVSTPWNIYCPRAIPAATAVGVICGVSLNLALWSVWGFLTPLILLVVFMGCLFFLHFVPWPC
eukprot:TRINITY_DN27083_c0_g1_i1.p1 TRINITY_DN27083_c0_g1~~TRINITY_DN27083_c0_g1_i1.p1  ORF type:complete len:160 (-),score=43.35 TRINITY_DN27083_c0_g1_i1:82-561(-)